MPGKCYQNLLKQYSPFAPSKVCNFNVQGATL